MTYPMPKDEKKKSSGSCTIRRIVLYQEFVRLYVQNLDINGAWRVDVDANNYKIKCKDKVEWSGSDITWNSVSKKGKVLKPRKLSMRGKPRKISSKVFGDNE